MEENKTNKYSIKFFGEFLDRSLWVIIVLATVLLVGHDYFNYGAIGAANWILIISSACIGCGNIILIWKKIAVRRKEKKQQDADKTPPSMSLGEMNR